MIHRLEVIVNPVERYGWVTESNESPSLDQIRRAIEAMDRSHRPLVYLRMHDTDEDTQVMEISGGVDAFFIEIADAEGFWFCPVNPNGSGQTIDIWPDNDGWSFLDHNILSLKDTLEVATHFATTGTWLPRFEWINVKDMRDLS